MADNIFKNEKIRKLENLVAKKMHSTKTITGGNNQNSELNNLYAERRSLKNIPFYFILPSKLDAFNQRRVYVNARILELGGK